MGHSRLAKLCTFWLALGQVHYAEAEKNSAPTALVASRRRAQQMVAWVCNACWAACDMCFDFMHFPLLDAIFQMICRLGFLLSHLRTYDSVRLGFVETLSILGAIYALAQRNARHIVGHPVETKPTEVVPLKVSQTDTPMQTSKHRNDDRKSYHYNPILCHSVRFVVQRFACVAQTWGNLPTEDVRHSPLPKHNDAQLIDNEGLGHVTTDEYCHMQNVYHENTYKHVACPNVSTPN